MSDWHKSTYSGGSNECVEAREYSSGADVRDTRNRDLGHLTFDRPEWTFFLETVRLTGR
ncbi:DUF397 domain-containing protein [Nocardiopsis sp. NPDC006832]|uniref:DUF397 domain-containing protein n=1 Tax=Nocardiopsis sp. NPDC006832 TaxID=3157188 RepID=UPI0033F8F481